MESKLKPKVVVHWRPTDGKPSPLWRRLWGKLLASRKEKTANTRHDASDGEMSNGNDAN